MKQLVKDTTFVAFDIETTGLVPVMNRIVEIGAVKFRDSQVIETFEELIDPDMDIPPEATAVNGITDEMVKGKPKVADVLPQFISFLDVAVPVAHNAPFDASFLSYDISRLNLEVLSNPILDTCVISKRVFPYIGAYTLGNVAKYFQITSKGFHRALADATGCMEILSHCMARMGNPGQVTLEEVLGVNGPALSLNTGEVLLDGPYHLLKEAFESGTEVEIVYCDSKGSMTARRITPLAIGLFRGTAMIEAFCHLRKDKRNFRLDRIVEIR